MVTARSASVKKAGSGTAAAEPQRQRGRPREFDRQQALSKAMRLFWRLGYEATSMADLRGELHVTQASLYAAFGSKEQLFREAVELYRETDGNTTDRALHLQPTARAAVEAMLRDAVTVFTQCDAPGGCLVVLGAIRGAADNKPVQDYLAAFRRETSRMILQRLRRGQREGDVSPSAPIATLAAYYTTVLHGLSIEARDGASRKTLAQVVDCAMATWPEKNG